MRRNEGRGCDRHGISGRNILDGENQGGRGRGSCHGDLFFFFLEKEWFFVAFRTGTTIGMVLVLLFVHFLVLVQGIVGCANDAVLEYQGWWWWRSMLLAALTRR